VFAMYTTASDISRVGNSGVANDDCDVAPFEMCFALNTQNYLGDADPKSPWSPLMYADYPATFPPTVMTTSTTDLIPSNSLRLRRCADGVSAASMLDGAMTGPDSVTYRNHCYSGSGDRRTAPRLANKARARRYRAPRRMRNGVWPIRLRRTLTKWEASENPARRPISAVVRRSKSGD
jgi:hypothetical protein